MKNKWFRVTKLSFKIAITYGLLFVLVLIALGGLTFFGVRQYLLAQDKQKLNDIMQETLNRVVDSEENGIPLTDEDILSDAAQDRAINIKVYTPSGILLNNSDNFPTPDSSLKDDASSVEIRGLIYQKTVMVKKDGRQIVYLQVAHNTTASHEFLETLFRWMVFADVLGIVLSLLLGLWMSRRMLRPIHKLIRTAEEIGTGLSDRIEVPPSNDELSQLAITFNEMLDRIQESFIKQGRFAADASHELRTPLTVIKGYAEMMDRWGKYDPGILQEGIDAILGETFNMSYIMDRLLFLARGDNGSQIIQKETFDVQELMLELEKETSIIAPNRRIAFHCDKKLPFSADRKLIKQMLRAVIDNSIKYTPPEGSIELSCKKQGNLVCFRVSDTGIGIPDEDQEHVFERFYRVDKARERKTGGSGLGLSIVQWIVQAHDGQIQLKSAKGEGTIMSILLPILSQEGK